MAEKIRKDNGKKENSDNNTKIKQREEQEKQTLLQQT